MVYDWFNRSAAAADTPPPEPSPSLQSSPEVTADGPPGVPVENPPSSGAQPVDGDAAALDWAKQAYARLKAQQEAAKQQAAQQAATAAPVTETAPVVEVQPVVEVEPVAEVQPIPEVEPVNQPALAVEVPTSSTPPGLSLLEQAAAQRAERQQAIAAQGQPAALPPDPMATEPELGAFDETFTWSAEVLAAQGKRLDQVSLEEIDWLSRLRQGLEKTRQGFVTQLLENLGDDPLTPEVVDDLEATLLRADVGVKATDQVLEALRKRLNEEVVDPSEGIRFLKEQLRGILDQPIQASAHALLAPQRDRLNVWLMVGVNGVGKTTTLGKLANLAVRSGYSCLIAAADTFRAAAVQQVQVWGDRSDVPVIANPSANADPAAVVFDAIGAAKAKGTELVLVDTAGRLQTKHNLMEELAKVRRIIDKLAPDAVVESLLVLDASQGQNGLRQAMAFAKAAGLTGVVLTKLDGSARGGVALAVASEAGLPIRFVGAGEGIRDLRPFNSFEFVEALLGG